MSEAWAKQARLSDNGQQVAESGDAPLVEDSELLNPETGEVLLTRPRHRSGTSSGLFDDEIRAGGNLLNRTGVERDYDRGVLIEEFTERDQNGDILGTREVTWEQMDDSGRTRVLTKSKFTPKKYFVMGR